MTTFVEYMRDTKDIETEEDIVAWIDAFYHKLTAHPDTMHFFQQLDLSHHLPKIVDFWCFVLLNKDGYTTNVFEKHIHLKLEETHFRVWLDLFKETTDGMFNGPKADLAKQRASLIASTFYHKMHGIYLVF